MAKKKEMDNLARDAAAALAANMSYGKWKALNPNTKDKCDEPLPQDSPTCQECGQPFRPRSYVKQKYCCVECQRASANRRFRENHEDYWKNAMAKKRAERKLMNESNT